MNPDVAALIKRAQGRGWVLIPGLRRHYRLQYPPTGHVVTVPKTPSDYRALRNCEALLARASGRLSAPPGPGISTAERNRRRQLAKAREASIRRRRATPPPDIERRRPRTAMEVAFDDYLAEHPISDFAPDTDEPQEKPA